MGTFFGLVFMVLGALIMVACGTCAAMVPPSAIIMVPLAIMGVFIMIMGSRMVRGG